MLLQHKTKVYHSSLSSLKCLLYSNKFVLDNSKMSRLFLKFFAERATGWLERCKRRKFIIHISLKPFLQNIYRESNWLVVGTLQLFINFSQTTATKTLILISLEILWGADCRGLTKIVTFEWGQG